MLIYLMNKERNTNKRKFGNNPKMFIFLLAAGIMEILNAANDNSKIYHKAGKKEGAQPGRKSFNLRPPIRRKR